MGKASDYYSGFLQLCENADPGFAPWIESAQAAIHRLGGESGTGD